MACSCQSLSVALTTSAWATTAYALVFYHGKQTPYPHSMNLADNIFDPLKIMDGMFPIPVPLIDINEITDDELEQQQLLGIMTSALKYSRDPDVARYIVVDMKRFAQLLKSMDLSKVQELNFSNTYLTYMFSVGTIANVKWFAQAIKQLPEPVRGEIMTAAEQFKAWGREEGLEKGREEGREEGREKGRVEGLEKGREEGIEEGLEKAAIYSLKEGIDPQFVARITGLELAVILKLKAQLEHDDKR